LNAPERDLLAIEEACDFLHEILAEGPIHQTEVMKKAKQADISESTLKRAKRALDVKSDKEEFSGKWKWRLP